MNIQTKIIFDLLSVKSVAIEIIIFHQKLHMLGRLFLTVTYKSQSLAYSPSKDFQAVFSSNSEIFSSNFHTDLKTIYTRLQFLTILRRQYIWVTHPVSVRDAPEHVVIFIDTYE